MVDLSEIGRKERRDKFHLELHDLQTQVLKLAYLAEHAIDKSIAALWRLDLELARQVIKGDKEVNDLEERLDNVCVRLIALYQPVAIDLRLVMAVDHIITELERIGDQAVNIAEETLNLRLLPLQEFHHQLPKMAQLARNMVRQSLAAFVQRDAHLAREVCKADDEVDYLDRTILSELLAEMEGNQESIAMGLSQIVVASNLERVADHATNIAEQVVYMVEGESIRHRCQG